MDDYRNDIDKYLKGQLTPAQMNALEKKALSDPFLADALEGLGSLQQPDLQADLRQLQTNLDQRTQQKDTVWPWIGRIAAGLLLVGVSTFLIIFISDRSDQRGSDNLALNKEKKSETERQSEQLPPSVADSSKYDSGLSQEATEAEEAKDDEVFPSTPAPEPPKRAKQPIVQIPAEEPAVTRAADEQQDALSDQDMSESINAEERVANSSPGDSAPPVVKLDADKKSEAAREDLEELEYARKKSISGAAAKERSDSYTVNRKIIRGRVTFSEDGAGLPGVNVIVKDTNEGTVTDGKGNYQIPVTEGSPSLLFSFIGFASKEVAATSEELNVQMNADVSELSEVVVVGYGSKDIEFLPSSPTVMELATPEGGRKVFKQYLEKNLRYPEQALENQVEGKVTVQFTIGMSGQLSDFRVIRGLGYGCDEEVIRLIKEGPKWMPTKKNEAPIKDRVRVRMRFSLPKK